MRKIVAVLCLLILVVGTVLAAIPGISSASSPDHDVSIVSCDSQKFPFIYLTAKVSNDGQPVNDLTQADFSITEDGRFQADMFQVTPPQEGGGVRMADIVFLIDASGSMSTEIAAVRNNAVAFANALAASDIDYRLGLVQFGNTSGPNPGIIGGSLTADAETFKQWVGMVQANGGYQPGFAAIRLAIQSYNFRPGSQKVFILISDEDSDDRDKQGTIDLILANDVTVHVAVDCSWGTASSDYCGAGSVRDISGGLQSPVTGDYSTILDTIGEEVANTYVVRYRTDNPVLDGIERTVVCTVDDGTYAGWAQCTYVPGGAPRIQRTQETLALHSQSLVAGSSPTISVTVTDAAAPFVQDVSLFIRTTGSGSAYTQINMVHQGSDLYLAEVPGSSIQTPGLDYYIRATDGQVTSTDPSTDPDKAPYQIAVLPNVAPLITHDPPSSWQKGNDTDLLVGATDSTYAVRSLAVFYRAEGELLWQSIVRTYDEGSPTAVSKLFTLEVSSWDATGIEYFIRATDDLGLSSLWPQGGADSPNLMVAEGGTHRVLYVPVRYVGDPEPAYSITDLKARAALVGLYYSSESYGLVSITSKFAYNEWKSLGKGLADYPDGVEWHSKWSLIRDEAIQMAGVNVNEYDSVVVVLPNYMRSFAKGVGGKLITTTEDASYAVWAHELGHTLFSWYDYYEEDGYEWSHGNTGYWDLMGSATLMNPTSPVMSYNKVKMGWLQYRLINSGEYGLYPVDLLTELGANGDVIRYRTENGAVESYVFEGRDPVDGITKDPDSPYKYNLSQEDGIELYLLTREAHSKSGEPKVFTVPHPIRFWPDSRTKVTLTPGKSYVDDVAEVEFRAVEEDGLLKIDIREHQSIGKRIVSLFSVDWNIPGLPVIPESLALEEDFDIDLHVYTSDGQHVGMDYSSLNYDVDIEGAGSSGNILGGGPEWISVPIGEDFYATIDPAPAREWAEATGIPIENITATWQVIEYDDSGARVESELQSVTVSLDEPATIVVPATVDFDPDTFNLKSKGKYVTTYIELPEGYDVSQIDIPSIRLNGTVPALAKPTSVDDYDKDGVPDIMVKFDSNAVQKILSVGDQLQLTITGKVAGIDFRGSDTIRVINGGGTATAGVSSLPYLGYILAGLAGCFVIAAGLFTFFMWGRLLPRRS